MANRIKIRRGSGNPGSNLLSYELGWDTTNKALYINDGGTSKIAALPLTGGTLSGLLTTQGNQYADSYSGAINMNNSNIFGLNSIYTADASDSASEGIHFYRDATHVDTLWMNGGDLLFVPNRALGTGTTKANSYIVLHSNNYTTYTVTKTGTGASGSWGISITGNAATATAATYGRITDTTPTSNTSYYLTFTAGKAANTNYALRGNALVKVWIAADGASCYLTLGDSSHVGGISLYSSSGKYLNLVTSAMADSNKVITFPNATGTVALTSDLSSYVLKAGDTMSGVLKMPGSSGVFYEGNPMFYWFSGSASSYQKQGAIFTTASTVNSKKVCDRFYFREYSYNSSTGAAIEEWDQYRLPTVTPDKTDPNTYEILTSKSAVTIAQGGTGATTAANAIKALLNGVATGTGAVTNDTYFIRQKDSNYSTVAASDIATYMINQVNIQDNVLDKTANYTLTAADSGKFIVVNSSSDLTITIPTNASSSIPRGAEYTIMRQGSGKVTINSSSITAVCSTTSRNLGTKRTTLLKKIATDTWYIDGEHLSS